MGDVDKAEAVWGREAYGKFLYLLLSFAVSVKMLLKNISLPYFPSGPGFKNPPASGGDTGLIPGPGRSHMQWGN